MKNLCLSFFLSFIFFSVSAQSDSLPKSSYANNVELHSGLGILLSNSSGVSFQTALLFNKIKGNRITQNKFACNYEFFILFSNVNQYSIEYDYLYGKVSGNKYIKFYRSIGIGIISGVMQGKLISKSFLSNNYSKVTFFTVGIPFELKTNFVFLKRNGFGIGLDGNANFAMSNLNVNFYYQFNYN